MPATNQWAVSTLIREVLADPDLAGRASCAACSGPGRTGPVGVRGRRRDRRAAPRRACRSAPTAATASASRRWPPPPGRSSSPFPSFAPDPSSRPCSTRAGGWTRPRCAVICSARSRGGLHAQGLATRYKALGNESGISRSTVSRIRDGHRRGRQGVPVPPPGPHLVPLPVRRAPRTWTCGRGAGWSAGPWWWPPACRPRAAGRSRNMALGDAQTSDFWTSLSCGPCANGGSRSPPPTTPGAWSWTTGDAHAGIRAAVRAILPGAARPRCRAPLRPHHHHPGWARPAPEPAGALVSTVFAQTTPEAVAAQYQHVIDTSRDAFPSESPGC